MLEELDKRLMEIKEKLRTKQRVASTLRDLEKDLAREKERLTRLEAELRKERTDVKKLEGLSLTAMFHQVLGSKDQRLDKERQEFLAAKLKYDQCAFEVTALERDIASKKQHLRELGDPEDQYRTILEQKEALILDGGDEELVRLTEKLADLKADAKEIGEAIEAGEHVLEGVDDVIAYFKSAGNWGVVDLVGGGLIVTAVKHSKINKAKAAIHEVQHRVGRFERELKDLRIGPQSPLGIEISSFQIFADYLFDGLIFDWIVQSKIQKSKNNALKMKADMERIIGDLRQRLKTAEEEKTRAEKEKNDLIETA